MREPHLTLIRMAGRETPGTPAHLLDAFVMAAWLRRAVAVARGQGAQHITLTSGLAERLAAHLEATGGPA